MFRNNTEVLKIGTVRHGHRRRMLQQSRGKLSSVIGTALVIGGLAELGSAGTAAESVTSDLGQTEVDVGTSDYDYSSFDPSQNQFANRQNEVDSGLAQVEISAGGDITALIDTVAHADDLAAVGGFIEGGRGKTSSSSSTFPKAGNPEKRSLATTSGATGDNLVGTVETGNSGMDALLEREKTLDLGMAEMKAKLTDYERKAVAVCPEFPLSMNEWRGPGTATAPTNIAMQLRTVALMMTLDVRPKVFLCGQGGYDTHSEQEGALATLATDLRAGLGTFVKAAKKCGWWGDVLVATSSEFGRRIAENDEGGTAHGWATYNMLFGKDLSKKVIGYNAEKGSDLLPDIIPDIMESETNAAVTLGDLPMTTKLADYQSCLLKASGLPEIRRLGICPAQMDFKAGLARIPQVDSSLITDDTARMSVAGDVSEHGPLATPLSEAHLDFPLSRADTLAVSRRIGYGPKTLDIENRFMIHESDAFDSSARKLKEAFFASGMAADDGGSAEVDASGNVLSDSRPAMLASEALKAEKLAHDDYAEHSKELSKLNGSVAQANGMRRLSGTASSSPAATPFEGPATIRKLSNLVLDPTKNSAAFSATLPTPLTDSNWNRKAYAFNLGDIRVRAKTNFWMELMSLSCPPPRHDGVRQRLSRWKIAHYFNVIDEPNWVIEIKASFFKGKKTDAEKNDHEMLVLRPAIFALIEENALGAKPSYKTHLRRGLNTNVDWGETIKILDDMVIYTAKAGAEQCTADRVMKMYSCNADGTHALYRGERCDPKCNMYNLLDVDATEETAELKDKAETRADGTDPGWRIVQKCYKDKGALEIQGLRWLYLRLHVAAHNLRTDYYNHMADPALGLRMRMTFFLLNWYATPITTVNDNILMWSQYVKIWNGALGNFRDLSHIMFKDEALRVSLDQTPSNTCSDPPIENFAREVLELFTVGFGSHNYYDIELVAKALQVCPETETKDCSKYIQALEAATSSSSAATTPAKAGLIFSNPKETLVLDTPADEEKFINRLLDFKMTATSAPATALRFCRELYLDMVTADKELLNPDSIKHCAFEFYASGYEISAALKAMMKDPLFYRTLGQSMRWPTDVITGAMQDWDMTNTEALGNAAVSGHVYHGELVLVGMPMMNPSSVFGFVKNEIWTLNALGYTHKFLSKIRGVLDQTHASLEYYKTKEAFRAAFADCRTYLKHPTTGVRTEYYGYAVRQCGGHFVDFKADEGMPLISIDDLWRGTRNAYARKNRWDSMQDKDDLVTNVCQFVA